MYWSIVIEILRSSSRSGWLHRNIHISNDNGYFIIFVYFFFPLSLLPDLNVYMSNTVVTVCANSSRAPAFPIGFLVGSVLLSFSFLFMLSYYVSLRSEFNVMMSVMISAYKRCLYEDSCLIYISCVCMHIVLLNTYFVVFFFVCFRLCLVYPMLPVSIGCPFMEKKRHIDVLSKRIQQ